MLPSWRLFLGFLVASNHKMNMPTLPMFIPSGLPRASIILMVFWSRPLTRANLLGAFVVRLIFLGRLRGWGKRLDDQIPSVKDTHDHDHDHGDLNEVSVNVSHVLNVLHPGTGNVYAIVYVLLTRAQVCLRAYFVLRGAYARLRAPQLCSRHTLTRGPLLNMNTRV